MNWIAAAANYPVSEGNRMSLDIIRVGADGDGIGALADGTPLYVPFTLPGESVEARPVSKRGDGMVGVAEAITRPSAARIAPVCAHFGSCGGCALQHWREDEYGLWKAGLLAAALRRAGYDDAPVAALITCPSATRRRVDLAVRRMGEKLVLGLHQAHAREIVELRECPVLDPVLAALLAPLGAALKRLTGLRREASAILNLLDSGPDLLLRTDADLNAVDRSILAAFAHTHGLPRISWAREKGLPEPVAGLRPARTMLSGIEIVPPPGAFLQASPVGEAAIIAAVMAGLPAKLPAKARIAELYAGCGTLSFALARVARVMAWEGDAPAVAALRAGARQAGLEGQITATQQDLARRPVLGGEFAPFAVAVLDPPFAGAAAQIAQIAASALRRVVYVSCNPAALARDAALLRQAGFAVLAATPIDQFLWSARLESVVVFARQRPV